MAKARTRIAIVAVAVVVFGSAVWAWRVRCTGSSPDEVVLYGNVDIRQVQLAFNGSERIAAMMVEEGARVTKGQVLAKLETDRLEPVAAQAEAQVRAQREIVARLRAGSRPEEIRKARADMEAAEAEARNARQIYQRRVPLAAKDVVSKEQADEAKAAAEAAAARVGAAKEALALAVEGPRREDIAAAEATLQAYEAELRLRRQQLADAELRAPSDGVIENRLLEPGDMASPQRPAYMMALTSPLWVRAYLSETDLGKVALGMSAEVRTDSYADKSYAAWIGFISPTAEFTPKSVETREVRTSLVYQVRVFVCDPQNELRLGMPATVVVPLNQPAAGAKSGRQRCESS